MNVANHGTMGAYAKHVRVGSAYPMRKGHLMPPICHVCGRDVYAHGPVELWLCSFVARLELRNLSEEAELFRLSVMTDIESL